MIILPYESKKVLKMCVGQRLRVIETSVFGPEYPASGTGKLTGANRPHITGKGREFFAIVHLDNHLITKVV